MRELVRGILLVFLALVSMFYAVCFGARLNMIIDAIYIRRVKAYDLDWWWLGLCAFGMLAYSVCGILLALGVIK